MDTAAFLDFKQAGQHLGGISRSTLYDLIAQGRLEKVLIGRRALITRKSIDEYAESLAGT